MIKKKLKNRIAIILDRSTSMGTIRTEAVQMFNDQIQAIQKGSELIKDTTVSLFTFSTYADDPLIFNKPAKDLKPLTVDEYIPGGWTALYDSIGGAIERLSALPEMSDPDCSFLVVVVTDGEENRSQKFTGQRLSDQIMLLQKTGRWTFTFCGANINIEKMANTLHIPQGNTMSWTASSSGALQASGLNSVAQEQFFHARATGSTSVMNFYIDPEKNKTPKTPKTTGG